VKRLIKELSNIRLVLDCLLAGYMIFNMFSGRAIPEFVEGAIIVFVIEAIRKERSK